MAHLERHVTRTIDFVRRCCGGHPQQTPPPGDLRGRRYIVRVQVRVFVISLVVVPAERSWLVGLRVLVPLLRCGRRNPRLLQLRHIPLRGFGSRTEVGWCRAWRRRRPRRMRHRAIAPAVPANLRGHGSHTGCGCRHGICRFRSRHGLRLGGRLRCRDCRCLRCRCADLTEHFVGLHRDDERGDDSESLQHLCGEHLVWLEGLDLLGTGVCLGRTL